VSDDAAPRILLQTDRLRIVETANGHKVVEKHDGEDAMGVPRWRDLKIGEADNTSRLLRDWIFGHLGRHPECCEGE
jgi:hypothetical protein